MVTPRDPLKRIRKICLALPEAHEKEAWGDPTFRVRDKMFAHFVDNHHGDGVRGLWLKAQEGAQEIYVEADPDAFFVPPYVGHRGWLGIRLDRDVDWTVVEGLIAIAWRMTAPKKLLKQVEGEGG